MNNKMIPFTVTTNGVLGFYFDGSMNSIGSDHPNYNKVKEALKTGDKETLSRVVNIPKAVEKFSAGRVRVENGVVYLGLNELNNTLTKRILALLREGFGFQHMLRFVDNIYKNPSSRAVNELYDFLDHFALPITEDGCFLAYKAVSNDYYSIRGADKDEPYPIRGYRREDGCLFNGVGEVLELMRHVVDDNRDQHCSRGLHCGAIGYVKQYGGISQAKPDVQNGSNRVMIVKINPEHVVSVPSDWNCEKMRCCQYEVIGEMSDLTNLLIKAVYTSTGEDLTPDYTEDTTECNCTDECDCSDGCHGDCEDDDDCCGCECGNSHGESLPSDFSDGYECGVIDGRKHSKKQFKVSDGSDFQNGYCKGYAEARGYKTKNVSPVPANHKLKETKRKSQYDEGYSVGWNCASFDEDRLDDEDLKGEDANYITGYQDGYSDYINTND